MSKVFINDLGLKCSAIDHSVFYRQSEQGHTIVVVATDNMAITSKHTEDITRFKSDLRQHWEITDVGEMNWFLGFQIKCDRTA